jgi:hemerythrin
VKKYGGDYNTRIMTPKTNQVDHFIGDGSSDIVKWGPRYATGIESIDTQHKELVSLTNELYRACLAGQEASGNAFREAMSRMVEYVRFHFTAEQKLLEGIGYPRYSDHKKKHEDLVRDILTAAQDFNKGKKFVANNFVRTLKEWVFGHIGIEDMIYAAYVLEMKKRGILTGAQIDALAAE